MAAEFYLLSYIDKWGHENPTAVFRAMQMEAVPLGILDKARSFLEYYPSEDYEKHRNWTSQEVLNHPDYKYFSLLLYSYHDDLLTREDIEKIRTSKPHENQHAVFANRILTVSDDEFSEFIFKERNPDDDARYIKISKIESVDLV